MSRNRTWSAGLRLGLAAAALAAFATGAAADRALVIGAPEDVRRGLFGGGEAADTGKALREAGFDVTAVGADSVSEMRGALSGFMSGVAAEPRIVIVLTGQFVSGDGRSWLLQSDPGTGPDLATVGDVGLSVETVLSVAGRVPGGAVVVLGLSEGGDAPGDGLRDGLGVLDVPQGVTVVTGTPANVASFVAEELLEPGRGLPAALAAARGVTGLGFLSDRLPFLPAGEDRPVAAPDAAEVERAIWQATVAQDSIAAFEGYLARYPEGAFAAQAREGIDRIAGEANRDARLAEEALELSRDTRRQIQRNLTLIGDDPKGVDGLFGSGSRAAITRFQTRNGFPATGYLTQQQIERLALQAEHRQAEQAAEEKRRQIERDRRDREAWAAVGEGRDEAGLRTYLERYPDGLHAAIARDRLARIEAETAAKAGELDRRDWTKAQEADTVEAYQAYLSAHPKGAEAATARQRIEVMQAETGAAAEAEAALGLNPVTRMLVEQRLEQLGHEPGLVDGNFDTDTRAAIRRFQSAHKLEVTGYMDADVVTQMLAGFGRLIGPGR